MGLTALRAVVQDLFARLGADDQLHQCVTGRAWATAVGPQLARYTEVACRRGDTLYVTVSGPVWMQQLHFLQADILARLNRGRDSAPLTGIRLRIGAVTGAPVAAAAAAPLVPLDIEAIARCRQAISDPQLRRSFDGLLAARRAAADHQHEEIE